MMDTSEQLMNLNSPPNYLQLDNAPESMATEMKEVIQGRETVYFTGV